MQFLVFAGALPSNLLLPLDGSVVSYKDWRTLPTLIIQSNSAFGLLQQPVSLKMPQIVRNGSVLNEMTSIPQMVRAAFTICPTSGLFDGLSPTVTSIHVTAFGSTSLADTRVDCHVDDAAATSAMEVFWLVLVDVELQVKQRFQCVMALPLPLNSPHGP
jgi:hypothetical protein